MSTGRLNSILTFCAVAALWGTVLAAPCRAQTTGAISGTVTDASGAPLPGVTVEARSPNLQGTRAAQTGADGHYRLPSVPPGPYRITAELGSFGKVQKNAVVPLDSTVTIAFQLPIMTTAEVVVTGEARRIDHASTTSGTSYTSAVVANLPVARNYADIVKANPGVSTDRGATEGRSLALAVYGATSAENQWVIDGVNTTNVLRGVQGKAINNEFVQEVEVKTGGYQAEYGRALGGVVNVITKSGGNEFRGDAFVYYDSTGTAAAAEFKPGDSAIDQMRVADGERFDYGFDLGGYVVKDRLWFFAAYNRVTLDGDLSRVESSTHVPASARFPFDSTDDLYSGKLTWNLDASTSVVASVFADPSRTSGAAGADPRQGLGVYALTPPVSLERSTWYSEREQGGTDFGVRANRILNSGAMATLTASYHRDRNALGAADEARINDNTCDGGTRDAPCIWPEEFNSVTGGYGPVTGLEDNSSSHRAQAAAAISLYRGKHEIKLGGDYMDGVTDATEHYSGGQQVYFGNEYGQLYWVHEFLAVSADDLRIAPGRHRHARVQDYGVYAQDSWRVTRSLTINAGLRWDGETSSDYAGETAFRFGNQWQPRLGLVWDPWRDGATKVEAFAGRFSYALPTYAVAASFADQVAAATTFNFDPVSVVPDPNVYYWGTFVSRGGYGEAVDAGLKGPYQDELTVGVERLLGPNLTVGLKGTYRRLGVALEDRCDFDYVDTSEFRGCAFINPGSGETFAAGNYPACNGLDGDAYQCTDQGPPTPAARRIYRGIELLVRHTLGNTLWLQASYVHSSLRGNYDGGVNQSVYGETSPGWNSDFDYPALWHNGYGTLSLDRPNRIRFDGYWLTPLRLGIGLQAFTESGAPVNQMGYFNRNKGPLIFLVPRGSAGRLPANWGTNLTLSYPVSIGPMTATLQAYLFNVFNKQIAISRDDSWSKQAPHDYPRSLYDPNQDQANDNYGSVNLRSQPRSFRAAVRVSF